MEQVNTNSKSHSEDQSPTSIGKKMLYKASLMIGFIGAMYHQEAANALKSVFGAFSWEEMTQRGTQMLATISSQHVNWDWLSKVGSIILPNVLLIAALSSFVYGVRRFFPNYGLTLEAESSRKAAAQQALYPQTQSLDTFQEAALERLTGLEKKIGKGEEISEDTKQVLLERLKTAEETVAHLEGQVARLATNQITMESITRIQEKLEALKDLLEPKENDAQPNTRKKSTYYATAFSGNDRFTDNAVMGTSNVSLRT